MLIKPIFSAAAIALTLYAFYPYIRGILRGSIRPHVFSWVIWGISTLVVFFAQLQSGGGAGAWAIGVSASITILIAVLAFLKRGDITITLLDWVFFVAALSSLPLWYMTASPLWAVVILTVVDLLGFGPTLRKAYHFPWSESLLFFGMFLARNLLVVLALERYSVTTWLFPVAVGAACGLLMVLLIIRRRKVGPVAVSSAE
jgi:hypothetical protein